MHSALKKQIHYHTIFPSGFYSTWSLFVMLGTCSTAPQTVSSTDIKGKKACSLSDGSYDSAPNIICHVCHLLWRHHLSTQTLQLLITHLNIHNINTAHVYNMFTLTCLMINAFISSCRIIYYYEVYYE